MADFLATLFGRDEDIASQKARDQRLQKFESNCSINLRERMANDNVSIDEAKMMLRYGNEMPENIRFTYQSFLNSLGQQEFLDDLERRDRF